MQGRGLGPYPLPYPTRPLDPVGASNIQGDAPSPTPSVGADDAADSSTDAADAGGEPSDTPDAPAAATDSEPATTAEPGEEELFTTSTLSGHGTRGPNLAMTWTPMDNRTGVVDVVLHLHGYSDARGRPLDFSREIVPRSGPEWSGEQGGNPMAGRRRPTVGFLPMGHFFGGATGRGYNFPAFGTAEGLNSLVGFGLAELGRRIRQPNLRIGRLILTAHSGGGAALIRILSHTNPHEVHVFDGLYGDPAELVRWARRRLAQDLRALASGQSPDTYMPAQGGALRVLYRGIGSTCVNSNAVAAQLGGMLPPGSPLRGWYRVEQTGVAHGQIPRTFGWRLLSRADTDLPGVAAAAPCSKRRGAKGQPSGKGTLDSVAASGLAGAAEAGRGASGGASLPSGYNPEAAVKAALEQYERWGRGAKSERDQEMGGALREYWMGLGDSRAEADEKIRSGNAWSAAFISFVMRKGGASNAAFKFSGAHRVYVSAAKASRAAGDVSKFRAYRIDEVSPEVGDLVCRDRLAKSRCGGTTYDSVNPKEGGTHCDLVIGVAADHITVVGGNVSSPARCPRGGCTVNVRTLKLDARGHLPPAQSSKACKHFAIVKPPARGAPLAPSAPPSQPPTPSTPMPRRPSPATSTAAVDRRVVARIDRPFISGAIEASAARHGVDPHLLRGIIAAESGGREDAGKGTTRHKGLMQCEVDVDQLRPEHSIECGAVKYGEFLRGTSKAFSALGVDWAQLSPRQQIELVMTSYNAGPATLLRAARYAAQGTRNPLDWERPEFFQRALLYTGAYSIRAAAKTCGIDPGSVDGKSEIAAARRAQLRFRNVRFKKGQPAGQMPDPGPTVQEAARLGAPPLMLCALQFKAGHSPGYRAKVLAYRNFFAGR